MTEIATPPAETSVQDASVSKTSPAHQPLPSGKYAMLLLSVTAVIFAFYVYSLVALILIGIAILVCLIIIVGGYQGGIGYSIASPWIHAFSFLGLSILRSLNLKRGVDYELPLRREDAPRLFTVIEQTAERVGVKPPQEIVLLHGDNAWVHLKGFRKGQGRSRLGIGYELLASLTEGEVQAIIAHEMAHAKLIQRGYQGIAYKGIARIHQFVETLSSPPPLNEERAYKTYHRLAGWFGAIPEKLSEIGTKLVATGSRQEEFKADYLAAVICGREVYQNALLHTHTISSRSSQLSWRDHLLQLDRGGYLEWLRGKLAAKDEAEELEAQNKALGDIRRSEFGTHPVLADRLAALPDTQSQVPLADTPAIDLLHEPEKLAVKLIGELERIANEQEQKENRRLRKLVRKQGKSKGKTPVQVLGILLWCGAVICLLWLLIAIVDEGQTFLDAWPIVASTLAFIIIGTLLYMRGGFRDTSPLPVPNFDRWEKTLKQRSEAMEEKDWRAPLAAELRASLPPEIKGKKATSRYWIEQCYSALAECDYKRADIASRLSLEADRNNAECLPGHCISLAYFSPSELANHALGPIYQKRGVGPSMSWAIGWVNSLIGDWGCAEAYLLDAVERRPQVATLHSLLAEAHWRTGKIREATESSNRAVQLEPETAAHRLLRARILLSAGRLQSASEDLTWLEQRGEERIEFHLAQVEAAISAGREEDAQRLAQETENAHSGTEALFRLAQEFVESKSETMRECAKHYFGRVLENGFYPSAHMGLARIAFEAKDFAQTRSHLLSALDVTAERPKDAVHPLSLLDSVYKGLLALDENTEKCTAWDTTLDLSSEPIEDVTAVSFLICHTTQENAASLIRELYMALLLNATWNDSLVTWKELPAREQPKEEITPGIYGHRLT